MPAAAPAPGPSLRQDIPRPPLRYLALLTQRRAALAWRRDLDRWRAAQRDLSLRTRASAARTAAQAIARLDAYLWQPAMWPFRPAQRELLACTLAALSVAIVAAGWIAAYRTLAPTDAVRWPAPLQAPPKLFNGRVVSPALLPAAVPIVEVP